MIIVGISDGEPYLREEDKPFFSDLYTTNKLKSLKPDAREFLLYLYYYYNPESPYAETLLEERDLGIVSDVFQNKQSSMDRALKKFDKMLSKYKDKGLSLKYRTLLKYIQVLEKTVESWNNDEYKIDLNSKGGAKDIQKEVESIKQLLTSIEDLRMEIISNKNSGDLAKGGKEIGMYE